MDFVGLALPNLHHEFFYVNMQCYSMLTRKKAKID